MQVLLSQRPGVQFPAPTPCDSETPNSSPGLGCYPLAFIGSYTGVHTPTQRHMQHLGIELVTEDLPRLWRSCVQDSVPSTAQKKEQGSERVRNLWLVYVRHNLNTGLEFLYSLHVMLPNSSILWVSVVLHSCPSHQLRVSWPWPFLLTMRFELE